MTRGAHRGAHPDDARLFAPSEIERLQRAARELGWLLDRGYAMGGALTLVGGHHQLEKRQRMALQRSVCARAQVRSRRARLLSPQALKGRMLTLDGFNVVISLEVALSGGLLLEGRDGVLRDLAGLRGSYHLIDETDAALDLLGAALGRLKPSLVRIVLDAPVANSGRLRARVLDHAAGWKLPTAVALELGVDRLLAGSEVAVTADGGILDRCGAWANLTRLILDERPGLWRVRLP